jgi:hypothetical protein
LDFVLEAEFLNAAEVLREAEARRQMVRRSDVGSTRECMLLGTILSDVNQRLSAVVAAEKTPGC